MKQSLWDLKPGSKMAMSSSRYNYEAIPMGFETCDFFAWNRYHTAYYEAIPMGFETIAVEFRPCSLYRL